MFKQRKLLCLALVVASVAWCGVPTARAARQPKGERESKSEGDFQASRLLKKAQDYLSLGEKDQGTKMLQTIIDQFPKSFIRYRAHLALGKHFLETHQEQESLRQFGKLKELEKPDEELMGEAKAVFLEGLYMTGVAYYRTKQYGASFPVLRKITRNFPNTVWANQAYYYIGMCHFEQENWNKAISALSLVGTFVDPESPNVEYVEASHRFYLKISDEDLPVMKRLGKKIVAELATKAGDKETVPCIQLSSKGDVYIGSIPTEIGAPKVADKKLQVVSGDIITSTYIDENTVGGEYNILRITTTKVVSTANIAFMRGNYQAHAVAAFLGQPIFVLVTDADKDLSPRNDQVQVRIISRRKVKEEDAPAAGDEEGFNIDHFLNVEKEKYQVRDELIVELTEMGEGDSIRTGRFGARVELGKVSAEGEADRSDKILSCAINDEILTMYVDQLHIGGDFPKEVNASLIVAGEIDGRPRATQNVVHDQLVRARKNLVEGSAYLALARIFKNMGLTDGSAAKCREGLSHADDVIKTRVAIPSTLKEEAFKLKWEMQLVMDDYGAAIQTCQVFNALFPDSPLVDEALMQLAKINFKKEEYAAAISICQRILRLKTSMVKDHAQFMIAQATEKSRDLPSAVPQYQRCAKEFPDSPYAVESLFKLVDYYFTTKEYAQADQMLEEIFQDYPDGEFHDRMLIKWVLVAYRMGMYGKAKDKCSELIFDYPSSVYAQKAKSILPKIERKVKQSAAAKPAEG